jgi:signal transduction histidine kinase
LFVAGVAHEFNNLLGAVDGHADWALETQKPEDMREALRVTRLACGRASEITRSLQAFLQPAEEQKGFVELSAVLQDVGNLLKAWARKNAVELNLRLPSLSVYGNASTLMEVFLNLVKNAIEAFARPGDTLDGDTVAHKVWIEATTEGADHALIRVCDNGPGVPAPFQELIFRPFFTTKGVLSHATSSQAAQGDSAPHHAGGGTGLGLFLSRNIVEEHGGRLTLDLNRSGPGACFLVRLPLSGPLQS